MPDDVVTTPDGAEHPLPEDTLQVVAHGDGYLAVAPGPSPHRSFKMHTLRLGADFEVVEDLGPSLDRVLVSSDGVRAAWTEVTGPATVQVAVDDGTEVQRVPLPEGERPELVGFTAAGLVVQVKDDVEEEVLRLVELTRDGSTELPPLLNASDAAGDLVVGTTVYDGAFCGGAVRLTGPLWDDCPLDVEDLSPDGSLVLGYPDEATPSHARLTVRDAETGAELVAFRGRGAAVVEAAWEDEAHLLAVVEQGGRQAVLRLGLDGTVERTTDVVQAEPMSTTWYLGGRPFE